MAEKKLSTKQLGEQVVTMVKEFVAHSIAPIAARLTGIEVQQAVENERLATLERRIAELEGRER